MDSVGTRLKKARIPSMWVPIFRAIRMIEEEP